MPETPLRAVAVFCGSRGGDDPAHLRAAVDLGHGLAARGIRLVYGGGRIGLMGAAADACLAAGGDVAGVIPQFLRDREIAHGGVGQLTVTDSMHDRKRRMFELADAFVILSGGFGTLDEFFEILTWRQLGLHDKPILVCDVAGWGDAVRRLLDSVVAAGFADAAALDLFTVVQGTSGALEFLDRLRHSVDGAPLTQPLAGPPAAA